ncbi:hypothetical protein ACFL1B_03520 [Nanoarchaeota archaeon]
MKKGQVAIEYLTTYGWVFLVLLIGIGTLMYFGFLSPSKFMPDRCWFSSQLICEDYMLTQNSVSFKVRNNFAKDIRIVTLYGVDDRYPIDPSTCNLPIDVGVRQIEEVTCQFLTTLFQDDKYSIPVSIEFRRNESGAPPPPLHNVSGEIFTRVN